MPVRSRRSDRGEPDLTLATMSAFGLSEFGRSNVSNDGVRVRWTSRSRRGMGKLSLVKKLLVTVGVVVVVLCVAVMSLSRPMVTIADVRVAYDAEQNDQAIELIGRVDTDRLTKEQRNELATLRGDVFIAAGQPDVALSAYESVAADGSETAVRAAMIRSEIYRQRGLYWRAANEYSRLVEADAANSAARVQLVQTMLLGGVRHRAWQHIRELIEHGSTKLAILSAAATPRAVAMIPFEVRKEIGQGDPLLLIGTTKLHLRQGLHDEAQRFVADLKALNVLSVETWVLDGWLRYDRDGRRSLARWVMDCPIDESDCEWHPEYWYLRGLAAVEAGDDAGAARCFFETLNLWPDYLPAVSSLAKSATAVDKPEIAATARERAKLLDDLATAASFLESGEVCDHLQTAAGATLALGRLQESAAWCTIAEAMAHDHEMEWVADVSREVTRRQGNSNGWVEPNQLLTDRFAWREFPQPEDLAITTKPAVERGRNGLQFRDDAASAGLSFEPRRESATEHLMRFFTGTGVGVIDYDRDLEPDLFFTQNSEAPIDSANKLPPPTSQLFRNRRGQTFVQSTTQSFAAATGFGQGVAVGDVDGDGFPDLYIGNVGRNELLLNNGDGTFRDISASVFPVDASLDDAARWTTSVAIADLDADGYADMFDANYLGGDDVGTRVCGTTDRPRSCSPRSFPPSRDVIRWGTGDASTLVEAANVNETGPANGLGVVIGNFDETAGLDVFVANDLTPNHLFVRSETSARAYDDVATFRGLAYDSEGASQACMGIACADLNDDGRMDFYVTNFHAERNALYLSESGDFFSDVVDTFQPGGDTYSLLGFGTQFLDVDLDGDDDLIVTNGHIWNADDGQTPYKMPPRLYERTGLRFQQVANEEVGPYFEGSYLGRALARLDWNVDGRDDVVITDLSGPAALLTNVTESVHMPLRIKLVGTETDRDAIGAVVTVTSETNQQSRELTAGDGYLCTNEGTLTFAVSPTNLPRSVSVRWPSGAVEEWKIQSDAMSVVLVEGDSGRGLTSLPTVK